MRELLHLTGHLVDTLDTAAAATSGDAVWAFALRVLAFRQDSPPGLGSVKPLEEAALKLVMSLTLKLTEGRFKPMFLRLVDWAATPPSSGQYPDSPTRVLAHPSVRESVQRILVVNAATLYSHSVCFLLLWNGDLVRSGLNISKAHND